MTFREMVAQDNREVFLNPEECADVYDIDGKEVSASLQDIDNFSNKFGEEIGVAPSSHLLFARTADLPRKAGRRGALNINGCEYIIDRRSDHMGMSQIYLTRNN